MTILEPPIPIRQRSATPSISAELLDRLGGIPVERIRLYPTPGTATMSDVEKTDGACELIDGTLVEKTMETPQSFLAMVIGSEIRSFIRGRNLGFITGEKGGYEMNFGQLRQPDVAFVNWDRVPGRKIPRKHMPDLVPDLAVEILSKSNTKAEMKRKRREYFASGVKLVWEVDYIDEFVTVYTSEADFNILKLGEILTGGDVLPGFELEVSDIFAELEAH